MSSVTSMPLIDHEGHVFRRVKDMAAFWGLYPELLSARWRSGLSLEECLTRPCRKQKDPRGKEKGCYDHKGKYFPNQMERARWWHTDANIVRSRMRVGWSLEKALTTGNRYERLRENLVLQGVADHTGRLHVSKKEMAAFWGVRYPLYCTRRIQGMSLADALLTPDDRFAEINSTTDHEGRVFPTISAMCEFWKIAVNTYRTRVKYLGWSKERALTSQKDQRYARNRKKS
jgi:hypothetical protein